jgi:hypothetical protein
MLAIKAEIVSEPVDIDTPCVFIARTVNRNTRDSLIVATIYRPINNDVDYAKALFSRDGRLVKNSSRVDLSLVGNLTVCDNPSSSSICRSVWLISFRYLLPLNVFVSQSMSGRLNSPTYQHHQQ